MLTSSISPSQQEEPLLGDQTTDEQQEKENLDEENRIIDKLQSLRQRYLQPRSTVEPFLQKIEDNTKFILALEESMRELSSLGKANEEETCVVVVKDDNGATTTTDEQEEGVVEAEVSDQTTEDNAEEAISQDDADDNGGHHEDGEYLEEEEDYEQQEEEEEEEGEAEAEVEHEEVANEDLDEAERILGDAFGDGERTINTTKKQPSTKSDNSNTSRRKLNNAPIYRYPQIVLRSGAYRLQAIEDLLEAKRIVDAAFNKALRDLTETRMTTRPRDQFRDSSNQGSSIPKNPNSTEDDVSPSSVTNFIDQYQEVKTSIQGLRDLRKRDGELELQVKNFAASADFRKDEDFTKHQSMLQELRENNKKLEDAKACLLKKLHSLEDVYPEFQLGEKFIDFVLENTSEYSSPSSTTEEWLAILDGNSSPSRNTTTENSKARSALPGFMTTGSSNSAAANSPQQFLRILGGDDGDISFAGFHGGSGDGKGVLQQQHPPASSSASPSRRAAAGTPYTTNTLSSATPTTTTTTAGRGTDLMNELNLTSMINILGGSARGAQGLPNTPRSSHRQQYHYGKRQNNGAGGGGVDVSTPRTTAAANSNKQRGTTPTTHHGSSPYPAKPSGQHQDPGEEGSPARGRWKF